MPITGSKTVHAPVPPRDKHAAACARDTGVPLPDWMTNPAKLPRKPPPLALRPARGVRKDDPGP